MRSGPADRRFVNRSVILESFRRQIHDARILLDFDGTLAPVVSDPGAARAVGGVSEVLARFAAVGAQVAVISGRPLSFLDKVCPDVAIRVGLYGLERSDGGIVTRHLAYDYWVEVVADVVARGAPVGLRVETKGPSATLDFRERPDLEVAAREWAQSVADSGLEVRDARQSIELHPPIEVDKGTAVRDIVASNTGPVLFAGDDLGDLAAFDALDDMRAASIEVLKIAVASAETPQLLADRADLLVDGPTGLSRLLDELMVGVS